MPPGFFAAASMTLKLIFEKADFTLMYKLISQRREKFIPGGLV